MEDREREREKERVSEEESASEKKGSRAGEDMEGLGRSPLAKLARMCAITG
jgi:hypothetical protein